MHTPPRRPSTLRPALLALLCSAFALPLRGWADPPSADEHDSLAPQGPGDGDHDGVPDVIDRCPNEAEVYNGVADDDGCPDSAVADAATRGPIQAVVSLVGRHTQVAPEVTLVVDYLARLLQRSPGITELTIEGHTDARGADEWNQLVSQARAEYVRNLLVNRGIAPQRLVAVGFGERCPAVAGFGPAVWQRNRRVRFVVTRSSDPRFAPASVGCAAARAP